ncbi:MAG: GTPase HflX, partial [Desulfovibrio sp.]|nr:GTPase HflX [Desulfovibrio sp.]
DRRRTRERMARLAKELDALRRQRAFTRSGRDRSGIPTAALVGYTNAGKSSLLNRLTNSSVLAEDKLFATLDTTTRRLRFPEEREIVVADTVGFIRSLPKELMEAFRATLEELGEADLLIHVADASQADLVQQTEAVLQTLAELGFDRTPRLLVLNKWDLLETEARASLGDLYPGAIHVSAKTGEGLKDLLLAIEQKLLRASYALDAQELAQAIAPEDGTGTADGPSEAPELDAFSALWPEGWDAPVQ